MLELALVDFENYVAKHLDQASVGVVCKARVVGALRQRLHAVIVQAEIQDGIHHAGHGKFGARTHTDEQWIVTATQTLSLQTF